MNDVLLPLHYSHGCVDIICIVGTFPKPFARKESAKKKQLSSHRTTSAVYILLKKHK